MAKTSPPLDVLVLGEHPCAYFATQLLTARGGVSVIHCTIPHEQAADRLVVVNPQLFALHKSLDKVKKKLTLCSVWGLGFLNDDGTTRGEFRAFLQSHKQIAQEIEDLIRAKLLPSKQSRVEPEEKSA